MSEGDRKTWTAQVAQLNSEWITAASDADVTPDSEPAQALARRHVEWLRGIPGTPAAPGGDLAGYVRGLAQMYVADERFAANYGGQRGAVFVRDALNHYLERS